MGGLLFVNRLECVSFGWPNRSLERTSWSLLEAVAGSFMTWKLLTAFWLGKILGKPILIAEVGQFGEG